MSHSAWRATRLSSSAGSQRPYQYSNSPVSWQQSSSPARTSVSQPSYPVTTTKTGRGPSVQQPRHTSTAQQESTSGCGEQKTPATAVAVVHPAVVHAAAMVLETITETDMEALSARSRGGVCPEGSGGKECTAEGGLLGESGRSKIADWMEDLDVAAYKKPRVLITSNAPPPSSPVKPSTAKYVGRLHEQHHCTCHVTRHVTCRHPSVVSITFPAENLDRPTSSKRYDLSIYSVAMQLQQA